MKKTTLILFAQAVLMTVVTSQAQSQLFSEEVVSTIDNFLYPSIDWTDYDQDGDQDVIISGAIDTSGNDNPDTSAIKLYNNDSGVFTEVATPNIYGLHLGFVMFVDIDNDGDEDLITDGQNYGNITQYFLTVYENNEGVFEEIQQLEGVIFASVDAGDYNNDGYLDLLVTGAFQGPDGADKMTKIYKNVLGVFEDSSITLPKVQNGNAQFGDFDNDQDLDIVIMGIGENSLLELYTNNNGVFTQSQVFPGMSYGSLSFVDFDGDEDLDITVMGNDVGFELMTKIYANNGGVFTEYETLIGFDNFSGTNPIAWADFDNDGDFDLVLSGDDDDFNENLIFYENNANSFTISSQGLTNIGGGTSLSVVDFNNDNNLDISASGFITNSEGDYVPNTSLFRNTTTNTNLKPTPPQNLTSQFVNDSNITFTWDNGDDDHTPATSLTYFLTIGSSEGASDIATYEVFGNSWTVNNLDVFEYYWSVQSIDGARIISDKQNAQVLGFDSQELNAKVTMFPNPANELITISLNDNSVAIEQVIIYGVRGEMVYATLNDLKRTNNLELNLSSLQKGMYIVSITTGNSVLSKKLILN